MSFILFQVELFFWSTMLKFSFISNFPSIVYAENEIMYSATFYLVPNVQREHYKNSF